MDFQVPGWYILSVSSENKSWSDSLREWGLQNSTVYSIIYSWKHPVVRRESI